MNAQSHDGSINVSRASGAVKRHWGQSVSKPSTNQPTNIADDGSGAGSGYLCVRGTAFDPVYGPVTGVFAEVFAYEPDSADHPSCPQGDPADHINNVTGEFQFDWVSAQHAALPGIQQWLLLCFEYTDSQTQNHYTHQVIPFYGVTANQTECGGSAAKAPKKVKAKKKPNSPKKAKAKKKAR